VRDFVKAWVKVMNADRFDLTARRSEDVIEDVA
jgi:catalase-peroxidase